MTDNFVKKKENLKEQSSQSVSFVIVSENEKGQRIDNFLFKYLKGVPKSHIYRILRSGEVRVNKKRVDQTYRIDLDDEIRIPPVRVALKNEKVIPKSQFDILFEDEALLIINKPAGIAVHGGSGVQFGIIEQLRVSRPDIKFLELIHRLDKETSGILMIAKKRSVLRKIHEQMRAGQIDKRYQTLVDGQWENKRVHVKLPLFKYTTAEGERRVKVQEDGLFSHTVFNLIKQYEGASLLEAELKTGRTHQIRVHLASSGHVILGDEKYGNFELNKRLQKKNHQKVSLKRMFLHAYRITFMHPLTNEPMTVFAPLPHECQDYLESLNQKN